MKTVAVSKMGSQSGILKVRNAYTPLVLAVAALVAACGGADQAGVSGANPAPAAGSTSAPVSSTSATFGIDAELAAVGLSNFAATTAPMPSLRAASATGTATTAMAATATTATATAISTATATATATAAALPTTAFNTQYTNDLTGDLPGMVVFGQHQLIPAKIRYAGDVQPHLTAKRKTLVMVKIPPAQITPGKTVSLSVYSKTGALLGTKTMAAPVNIPKQTRYSPVLVQSNATLPNFDLNPVGAYTISTNAELEKLNDPKAQWLTSLLKTYKNIIIATADGAWTSDIYLPQTELMDRQILLRANAGYRTNLHRLNNSPAAPDLPSILISKGTIIPFAASNGWVIESDLAHSKYVYGHDFWSTVLPSAWVQPGLRLQVNHAGKVGTLSQIEVGGASELLVNTIDIGMLTAPRNQFAFAKNADGLLHKEYFETLPVSKMMVSVYEPAHLTEVVLPDGVRYTTSSADEGGGYIGDMRERIGKELISIGIDNANYGINSAPGTGGDLAGGHPYLASLITAHNSQGMYKNGLCVHGWSGGAGMVTLFDSVGNEWSHELGHNYGLGHYPGSFAGSVHRPADSINSTWGWDSRSNRFIPNFNSNKALAGEERTCQDGVCQDPFMGFAFGRDAMGGGGPTYPEINRFTMHTPYASEFMQRFFEEKIVFSPDSSTGFRKWNPTTKVMEPYTHRIESVQGTAFESKFDPAYILTMPEIGSMQNGQWVASPSGLQALYDRGLPQLKVHFYNGFHVAEVAVPPASSNAGKTLIVSSDALYSFNLKINDQTVLIRQGARQLWRSTGSTWVQEPLVQDLGQERKPQKFGVPVTTLVGFYDPQGSLQSYIYPAMHGGYGYTYADDASTAAQNVCELRVQTALTQRRYKLSSVRINASLMNRFHVNIPMAEKPTSASVVCGAKELAQRTLDLPKGTYSRSIVTN